MNTNKLNKIKNSIIGMGLKPKKINIDLLQYSDEKGSITEADLKGELISFKGKKIIKINLN